MLCTPKRINAHRGLRAAVGTDANPIVEAPVENQEIESMESDGIKNNEAEYFEEENENEESGELQTERVSGTDEQD